MSFLCAQLGVDGVAHTIARLKQPVQSTDAIPLAEDVDVSEVLGRRYEGGQWKTVTTPKVETAEQARLAELSAKVISDMTAAERQEELVLRMRSVAKG